MKNPFSRTARLFVLIAAFQTGCTHQMNSSGGNASADASSKSAPTSQPMDPVIAQIRDEGINRSKVMDTLDYLCDVIGPRLTGSWNCKEASEWTRDTLHSWGMSNAHIEPWGPFGRGWAVKRFSMQVIEPQTILLNGYPKAWSPGFDKPFDAPVVYLDATKEDELAKYKGKLKGAVVLIGAPRTPEARYEPLAKRITDEDLAKLAAAEPGSSAMLGQQQQARALTASERRAQFAESGALGESLTNRRGQRGRSTTQATTEPTAGSTAAMTMADPTTGPTTGPTTNRAGRRGRGFNPFASRLLAFVVEEGALVVVSPSTQGDGGTYFVQSASIPNDNPFDRSATRPTTRPRVWSNNPPKIPAQVTLAVEDYNRMVRMIQRGQTLKMAVDLQVKFKDDDEMSYDTVAEIPGTDPKLKDQVVMVGAHLDSWQSGTGATDNGVGSASAMEAIRILKALNLKPRRTIRVALWTGEEEGLFGSEAYVKQHFGYDPNSRGFNGGPTGNEPKTIVKTPEYEKLSVYFNLDNGTGKIRGIYAQGNSAAVPYFKKWLAPFADMGAKTITLSNTGSTDHISFDSIGLPGFQFIQDPIDYASRTHHSNEDVYDRIQADDMKQASTIMAAFLWDAANMDERFPRKSLNNPDER